MVTVAVVSMTIGALFGCREFGDEAETTPLAEAGSDAAAAGDSPGGPDGAVDAEGGPAPPCPSVVKEDLTPFADACIASGAANQNRGDSSICNLNARNAAVIAFKTSSQAKNALLAKTRYFRIDLVLTRATNHEECDPGDSCISPTYRRQGTLFVRPLHPDWSESQVTWNGRADGNVWQAAGALGEGQDVLGEAGKLLVPELQMVARVPLDPAVWTAAFVNGDQVSVRVSFLDQGDPAPFVAVLREPTFGVAPLAPPRLQIEYCP